jgi:hypothetical protein
LAQIVAAWPALPAHVKAAIKALVGTVDDKTPMWRIIDHTEGCIRAALETEWSPQAARETLERRHCFRAAMDIAHELAYLGFKLHEDFDVRPVGGATLESPMGID